MNPPQSPPAAGQYVQFSLDRLDVLRCRLWVLAHNKTLMTILALMCLGFPVMTYRPFEGMPNSVGFLVFYFVMMTAVMVVFMVLVQIAFQVLWLLVNKNRGVTGEHEYEIRDDGFLEKTPFNESLYRWAGFHKIAASRSFLFVFVTDNIVQYIPLRVFASKDDAARFRAEIQRRVNAAQSAIA